ncbi:uncharacterized protein LOC114350247 isoform X1 [Ostrinia furnacalis]|uniref:uncharacterized protein LOC114350247 isoform X1 n=2 Tax=Ostrinia furnacalis TaxID=93504 RepID=UPI0010390A25|nr:uncharacterized protein LOC114350247 isoform X1 [Ostrinia furnacalis]
MAEACRLGLPKSDNKLTISQEENFCVLSVLCVFISLVTILADLTTDILVFAEYCNDGHIYWAIPTLIFIITPNLLINIFSIRWYAIDQKSDAKHWLTHLCLVGLLERYIVYLHKVFACKNLESLKTQKLFSQRNDLSLLHFLYIFTGTVPQVILQSYAIVILNENYYTKAFALTASIASIVWGCATYIYSIFIFSNDVFHWKSLLLQLIWHFSMLLGRISSILLFTVIFGIWTLIPLGLHWSAMTFWIIIQKTTFCSNKLEETLYNVVMGFVYCFCYINLREGQTRYRILTFYTLIVTQNLGSLFLYVIISDIGRQQKPWSITCTVFLIGGTFIGLCSMIFYYRYFHSKGPIEWKIPHEDLELNNKTTRTNPSNLGISNLRCFKSSQKEPTQIKNSDISPIPDQESRNDTQNADKNFLLDHWIARSGTPTFSSVPIGNNSMDVSSVEFYTVENTPQVMTQNEDNDGGTNKRNTKNYKLKICSPTELTLKLTAIDNLESSIDEITCNNLNSQKRRGICSSDELRDDLTNINIGMVNENFMKSIKTDHSSEISQDTDGSNKKTSSDSIDMDLDLSFSDINSSDINTFNENIVQKLCLSALKNIKVGNQDADIENIQRIALDILKEMYAKKGKGKNILSGETFTSKQRDLDTPTEMLSVHDYENICAVNIAREAWGLRSWNGYSDIENWLHDGSVVRDRRRDTLTSGSSEISSCLSQELKNAILSASPFPKKAPTYSNVFVKFERSSQEDYVNAVICHSNDDTFLAKPCMTDISKDPNHLEPIMEELDDLCDKDQPCKKRLNSESSLVATIDEIRKATVTNSPRNLYHRREHMWDSPQFDASVKIGSTLKRALWKEPSKFNSSNIMESLPEKENIFNLPHGIKNDQLQKDLNLSSASISQDSNNSEIGILYNRNMKRRMKSNMMTTKTQPKKINNKSEHNLQDLSNKDIDLLWQIVTENTGPHSSAEDLSSNRISTSLQSLIQKDASSNSENSGPTPKMNNIHKKGIKGRPRRKFSILRERFEPRISLNSDEEILYHCSENLPSHLESIVHVKNNFSTSSDKCVDGYLTSKPDSKVLNRNKQENVLISPKHL